MIGTEATGPLDLPVEPLHHRPSSGSILDAWDAHVAVLDEDGHIVEVNQAWARFARENGGDPDGSVGPGADYLGVCRAAAAEEPVAAEVVTGLDELLTGVSEDFAIEYACPGPEGARFFRLTARAIDDGDARRVLTIHEDVTAQRRTRDDVRTRSMLLDEVDAAVIVTDTDGIVTTWNRAAERLYGWPASLAVGRPIDRLTVPTAPHRTAGGAEEALGLGSWEGRYDVVRRDGAAFPAFVRNVLLRDEDGRPSGVVGVSVDLSEQVRLERRLARSNRQLQAITHSMGEGLCTLDTAGRITYVNPHGLRLLRATLDEAVGGRFLQWLHDTGSLTGAEVPVETDVARPLERQLVRRDGSELPIEYVATPLVDGDDELPGWVIVFRDISERRARQYERILRVEQLRWFELIEQALATDGFVLHAQPIVDLLTGRTVQHELLLRMVDVERPGELIAPSRFLPTAEQLGLAPAIDRWVVREGLRLAATGLPVEINLSATSLDDPALPDLIETLLAETGADPADVIFEVTETALVDSDETARRFADRIHRLGCGLALDDFGTGYGGFTYLKRLPVDYLKIDIEFVRDAVSNPASRHVVDAVVSLARAFGLSTVAEGVEDEETLQLLKDLNVDLAQGYLLGRPAPIPAPVAATEDAR